MRFIRRLAILTLAAAIPALVPVTASAQAAAAPVQAAAASAPVHECDVKPAPGFYTCFAMRRTESGARRAATALPAGFGPADLKSAYKLPSSTQAGPRVYVIDAYGYANAESDLATYRNKFGLPPCTTSNGCFKKLNQNGQTSPLPGEDSGWAGETALDLDMVSAVCPRCSITLIEATDSSDNLFKAVARATSLGAKYVSMSWGGPETGTEATYDSTYFNKTGVVYAASSGDGAYDAGVSYPSTSKNVVAVGGTSLVKNASARGWSELVWYDSAQPWGTGSGCSSDEAKPSWQAIISGTVCAYRAGNDVSAVGDPYTGVAVYQFGSSSDGWSIVGGTSAGAPIITSVYALAGAPGVGDHPGSYPYARTGALNDVTVGSNGSCATTLLCNAAVGWDGPTGLGTPNGVTAFKNPAQIITMINPGPQVASINNPVSLTVTATDSPSGPTLSYVASGLPSGLTMATSGTISGSPTKLGLSTVTVTASDSTSASSTASFTWRVGDAGTFATVAAARLLDTRAGIGAPVGMVPSNGSIALQVLGRGGVPFSGVSAVVLNVTVNTPSSPGFITVYPDGGSRPTTSNLNYLQGQTVPNLVVAPVGADGKVRLYASSSTHLIADVAGYYLKGAPVQNGAFAPLNPARLLDTRNGTGAPAAPVPAGGTVAVTVLGRGGVPADHVSAVVLNVTATGSRSSGYLTAYASGKPRPGASNLNFPAGRSVPNLVVVPVGADGKVALWVAGGGGTNLLADVFGYYTDGNPSATGTLGALAPARLLDTRDGNGVGGKPITVAAGDTVRLQVTGRGNVPSMGVSSVVLNVLVTGPTGAGYVTVYSDDAGMPVTSNLNYLGGQTVANLVVVPVSSAGFVDLTVSGQGTTALVADVSGYYVSGV